MTLDYLFQRFEKAAHKSALIWKDGDYSYSSLLNHIQRSIQLLNEAQIEPGSVVALEGELSPNSIAMMLALVNKSCIYMPLVSCSDQ